VSDGSITGSNIARTFCIVSFIIFSNFLSQRTTNFPPSAAELFRLPPHRSGTHYQTQSFQHQLKTFLFQRSFIY